MRNAIVFLLITSLLMLNSCATIVHGPKQNFSIISHPANANIYIDGQPVCNTPCETKLERRKERQLVRIDLAGYTPYDVQIERNTWALSPWVLGNFILLPLFWVGFIVDGLSGSAWEYQDSKIEVNLGHPR